MASGASSLMNTVKVKRVGGPNGNQIVTEEAKQEEEADDAVSASDCLMNYTFDMSLDDHMRAGVGHGNHGDDVLFRASSAGAGLATIGGQHNNLNILSELDETHD